MHTKPMLEDDMLFNEMLYQCGGDVANLRSGDLRRAYAYALNFADLPGGVHFANDRYFPMVSFNTIA